MGLWIICGHAILVAFAAIGLFLFGTLLLGFIAQRRELSPIADRAFFLGQWLVNHKGPNRIAFVLELRDDGTAKRRHEHGPTIQDGTWRYTEGEATIEWARDTGILIRTGLSTDVLKPDGKNALLGSCLACLGGIRPIDWHPATRISQKSPAAV